MINGSSAAKNFLLIFPLNNKSYHFLLNKVYKPKNVCVSIHISRPECKTMHVVLRKFGSCFDINGRFQIDRMRRSLQKSWSNFDFRVSTSKSKFFYLYFLSYPEKFFSLTNQTNLLTHFDLSRSGFDDYFERSTSFVPGSNLGRKVSDMEVN